MSTIPQAKDPIIIELERICKEDLDIPCSFMEANLGEANLGVDDKEPGSFPMLLFITTSKNRSRKIESDVIIRKAQVTCMLLDARQATPKSGTETSDYMSSEINDQLNRMRLLGENLWFWINRSSLSINGGVDDWASDPVYERFDADLIGQAIQFDWTIDTHSTGHYNVAP